MSEQSQISTVFDPTSALQALEVVAARSAEVDGQDPALHAFLVWLASSGRDGALLSGAGRARFVAAGAPVLMRCFRAIDRYVYAASSLFLGEWYGDEWRFACEVRTRIDFLLELYRGTVAEAWLANAADPGDLDAGLRGRGEEEGYLPVEQIPPGTPPSHWWWWYPRTPPGM